MMTDKKNGGVLDKVRMEKGGPAAPKVLPKRKPKATATSTNRKTGATRGAGDDKEYMRKAAAANMESGGEAKKGVLRNVIDQSGNRRKFLRSDEGKAEKKARKLHNERMGPTDKGAKRKLRRDAKKADAAKGALMLNKGGSLNDAIQRVKKAQGMKDGGEAMGRTTTEITKGMMDAMRELEKSGKRLKPIRPRKNFPSAEQRKKMQDIEFIRDGIEMIPVTKKEDGGAVPKKYKGFSKLPERVQQKIDPDLAGKYEKGGVVRGMGRAYAGGSRPVKIR